MLDVARNTSRNMGRLGVVPGGGRRPSDVGCCTQHARNMLATLLARLLDLTADG
jgi:hypothetical protein